MPAIIDNAGRETKLALTTVESLIDDVARILDRLPKFSEDLFSTYV